MGDGVSVEASEYYDNTKQTVAPAATAKDTGEQTLLTEGENVTLGSGDVVTMPTVARLTQQETAKADASSSTNTNMGNAQHKDTREYPQTGDSDEPGVLVTILGALTTLLAVFGLSITSKRNV